MRLSPIVLLLRAGNTSFGDEIAGSAEFGSVQEDTLEANTAYVIQLSEVATPNTIQGDVSQKLVEGFGVVVAIKNDQSQADKTGLTAFDSLFNVRKELWKVLIGLFIDDEDPNDGYYQDGPIYYKGGTLLDINPAWLWYQFEFEYPAMLTGQLKEYNLDDFNTLSAQWVMTPNAQIPLEGAGDLPDALESSDMDSIIDFTENLLAGAFSSDFAAGFDLYKG